MQHYDLPIANSIALILGTPLKLETKELRQPQRTINAPGPVLSLPQRWSTRPIVHARRVPR